MLNSDNEGKSILSSHQCCNCIQLENQLKETWSELSSVKLTVEILNEEIKSLEQISPTDSNADSSWSVAKSSTSRGLTTLWPSKDKHTSHVIPPTTWYAVPVANRYESLSNHNLQNQKRTQLRWSVNEVNETHAIPMIINCQIWRQKVRRVTNPRMLIQRGDMKRTIKECNEKSVPVSKWKVAILGDSHLKGSAPRIDNYLSSKFEVSGFIKQLSYQHMLQQRIALMQ